MADSPIRDQQPHYPPAYDEHQQLIHHLQNRENPDVVRPEGQDVDRDLEMNVNPPDPEEGAAAQNGDGPNIEQLINFGYGQRFSTWCSQKFHAAIPVIRRMGNDAVRYIGANRTQLILFSASCLISYGIGKLNCR